MPEWRLVETEFEDPYMNMALEEAIPTMVGEGLSPETVRFWRNLNAVVIGYFQNTRLEVNLDACHKYGTTIVRRFTGGGAVYHDLGNLNYAVSLSRNNPLLQEDVIENFRTISKGVIYALRRLGLSCEFGPNNLIHIKGRKLSGIAGSLDGKRFFQHGTLLVSTDLRILMEVLSNSGVEIADDRGVRSLRSPVTSLRDELKKDILLSQVRNALIEGLEETFSIRLVPATMTSNEKKLTRQLYETKYSRRDWNLQF